MLAGGDAGVESVEEALVLSGHGLGGLVKERYGLVYGVSCSPLLIIWLLSNRMRATHSPGWLLRRAGCGKSGPTVGLPTACDLLVHMHKTRWAPACGEGWALSGGLAVEATALEGELKLGEVVGHKG